MNLRVDEAGPDEAPILRNLGELYVHDFSEFTLIELNVDGRFDRDLWHGCWAGDQTPYLFRVDGHLAGFAVVGTGSRISEDPSVHDMAQFFVVRRYRRHGIGTRAAADLFKLRPGTWEVREIAGNDAALRFWRNAIGAYTGNAFDEFIVDTERWRGCVQRFVA